MQVTVLQKGYMGPLISAAVTNDNPNRKGRGKRGRGKVYLKNIPNIPVDASKKRINTKDGHEMFIYEWTINKETYNQLKGA